MYIVQCDTGHFNWMACGNTEQEASNALKVGWLKHEQQMKDDGVTIPPMWETFKDDIYFDSIEPGQCMRDSELI